MGLNSWSKNIEDKFHDAYVDALNHQHNDTRTSFVELFLEAIDRQNLVVLDSFYYDDMVADLKYFVER